MKILAILVLAIIGGIVYRMGGSGNYPRYLRELGQGICFVLSMLTLGMVHWSLVLSFGITWGESTYFKKKGTDARWWNWALVGLLFGLIAIPYCVFKGHWIGFAIRVPVCVGLTVLWQIVLSGIVAKWFYKTLHKDVTDEFGRGFINIITIPLLLIGA